MIPEVVDRVVRAIDPLKIIVFGSHARGNAAPDSDIDLLVVLPSVDDKRAERMRVMRLFVDLTVPVDVLVTTPEEIAKRGDALGSVLRPALREGLTLYERA